MGGGTAGWIPSILVGFPIGLKSMITLPNGWPFYTVQALRRRRLIMDRVVCSRAMAGFVLSVLPQPASISAPVYTRQYPYVLCVIEPKPLIGLVFIGQANRI